MATPAQQVALIDEKLAGYTVKRKKLPAKIIPDESRKVTLMANSTRLLALTELRPPQQHRLARIRELLSRLA